VLLLLLAAVCCQAGIMDPRAVCSLRPLLVALLVVVVVRVVQAVMQERSAACPRFNSAFSS